MDPRDTTPEERAQTRVLLLEGIPASAVQAFEAAGYRQIERLSSALDEAQLRKRLPGVQLLGIRSRTQLSAAVLAQAPQLLAVGCFCIGTNQVDLVAARQQGIAVFNAPYANTRSVAELVLAEAVLLLRGIPEKNAAAHAGRWLKGAEGSHEIRGKVLGIVGYGNIGTQLSVLAEALGMQVRFHDVVPRLPLGNARQVGSLHELLVQADVLSLHVPETPATEWMVGEAELGAMKPGAVLINASRGRVVEVAPLARALRERRLAGAAIDVFPAEPSDNQAVFLSELRGLDNALLTPHIGGSTQEAQAGIGAEVAGKLLGYSDTGTTTGSVNFPEVALPAHPGQHRLLHVHRNMPGVLSALNQALSAGGLNIAAQYLQTREDIGYVVTDIDARYPEGTLRQLAQVPGTLRLRVLG